MRIRSIKPEFWRDETIVSLPISARLTFIGLWSYVDDNGVGDARLSSIVADLYAHDLSCNLQETLRSVSGDLQQLQNAGLIVMYTDPNQARRELVFIRNWDKHQVVNRPSKGHSYPLPPAEMLDQADTHANCMSVSRDTPETLSAGAGEQGNRGTGESLPPALRTEPHQRASANTRETRAEVRMRELNATARSAEADRFATSFNQWAGGGIPSQTLIEIAQEVDTLLGDRIDPVQIADGIKAWHASDRIYPSQIPGFVAKAARPADTPKPTKATLRAVSTLDDAEALIAQFQEGTA